MAAFIKSTDCFVLCKLAEKSAEYKKQYEKMEKYSSNYCYGMSYDRTKWVYWNF